MAMNTPEWVVLCRTEFRKYVSDTLKEKKPTSVISYLMDTGTWDKEQMTDGSYTGLGDFQEFTGVANTDTYTEEYSKTIDFPEFTKTVDIRKKLWDDARKKVFNVADDMAVSAWRTREKAVINVFNNAFDTTVTWGDSKALCATDHPTKVPGGSTFSNAMNVAFSPAQCETMRQNMAQIKDGNNNYVEADMDLIFAPLILEEEVWEYINSKGKVNTADNNRNYAEGRYKMLISKYLTGLTKATAPWFGIDSRRAKMSNTSLTREAFSMEEEYTPKLRMLSFTGAERRGIMVSGWRWLCGSKPA